MFFHTAAGRTPHPSRWPRSTVTATGLAMALALGGCSTSGTEASSPDSESASFFDDTQIHDISVNFSDEDYQAMLETYTESSDKDWISATVTIDGTTLENVGLRLKGNSSLQGLSGRGGGPQNAGGAAAGDGETEVPGDGATAPAQVPADGTEADTRDSGDGGGTSDSPETLPWLIRTDKFVDGQQYQGRTDLVVRGNNSESSLNEALALELTGAADLATLEASAARFSVNDSKQELRLIIESPDDEEWNEETFGGDGSIYKAESGGDYSYRGDNAEDYKDVFEQKTGEEDLQPVIKFLDFINNSSDEDFNSRLGDYLDIDAFATYLAAQDLMGNMDDIDGPGNNSYLRYDSGTGLMTVVTWDLNLTFGSMGGGMPDGAEMPDGVQRPEGMQPPEGMQIPEGMQLPDGAAPPEGMQPPEGMGNPGGAGGAGMSKENALASRFMADTEFKALYESKLASLRTELYDSGEAQQILDKWTDLLTEQATDLVPAETVQEEAANISKFFTADAAPAAES